MALNAISNVTGAKTYTTTEVKTTAPEVTKAEQTQVEAAPAYSNFNSVEPAEEAAKGNVPSENTVKQAVSDINKKINPNTIAQYGFHEDTNRVTIKIVDKNSDKVIREFPAEETLDMIAKVWELAGMFLDERG